MLNLNPTLLLILTACLFILIFGGLSLLRREGLSIQFAVEAVAVTALLMGGAWLLGLNLSPVLLLIVLYLVTQRSRLSVDIANLLARRGRFDAAFKLYRAALTLWPDASSRLIVLANRGAAEVLSGQLDTAVNTFQQVLQPEKRRSLGAKYEAATRYNLGYAFQLKGDEAQATREWTQVIELMPASVYARAAQAALKRRKEKTEKPLD